MKYRLSPLYQLNTLDSIEIHPEFAEEAINLSGEPILISESKGKVYLINKSINDFLLHYKVPRKLENVVFEYTNSSVYTSDIEQVIHRFFDAMVRKKILIPDGEEISLSKKAYKFELGSYINSHLVTEHIANKTNVDVYRATNDHAMDMAIKLVHRDKFNDERQFQKSMISLQQEADLLLKLSAVPKVVNLYGFNKMGDYAYLEMEYVAGENLRRWATLHSDRIGLRHRLDLVTQLLIIFAQIHALGIIHGDIHASNFIVADDQLTVIDFGNSQHKIPRENEVLYKGGVAHYMPPERIQSKIFHKFVNYSDLHSEVYQLGILAYFIVYDKTPFNGLTWNNLSLKIREQEAVLAKNLGNGEMVPPAVRSFIKKAISKEPKNRFADAIAMLESWKVSIKGIC